jgi:hypothetical protein
MTDANPAHFSAADYARTTPTTHSPAGSAQPFRWTADMTSALVVVGGSLVMALAGMGLGAWLQLPFGG